MKKFIVGFSIMTATLLMGNETAAMEQLLNIAVEDAVWLNNYSKEHLEELGEDESTLAEFTKKVEEYERKVSAFSEQKANEFTSTQEALKALEDIEKLSSQGVVLAKITLYLASHHADDASDSYNETLKTLTQTTLRLSDDIGVMADRIGEMADRIGVMADRILETQRIQSENYQATLKLAQMTMQQMGESTMFAQQNMQNAQSSAAMSMQTNSSQEQQASSQTQMPGGMGY